MQHLDPDDLALLALGENLGDAVDAHVATCATCRDEVESFRLTVGLAELSNYGEDAPQPGEHVWAAIATELGLRGTRSGTATLTSQTGESDGISDLPTAGAVRRARAGFGARGQRLEPRAERRCAARPAVCRGHRNRPPAR